MSELPGDPGSSSTPLAGRETDSDYWHSLITEAEAANFLGFTVRCLQNWRYRGGGPVYVKPNARNVRYRRIDLRRWAEARLRTSTSDGGEGVPCGT